MAAHRYDNNINELKAYFTSVIDWITSVFDFAPEKEMCGLKWGELYERFHNTPYNPVEVTEKVRELYESFFVKEKKGIYEYILDGCQENVIRKDQVDVVLEPDESCRLQHVEVREAVPDRNDNGRDEEQCEHDCVRQQEQIAGLVILDILPEEVSLTLFI